MDPPDEALQKNSATYASGNAAVMLQYSRRRHVSGCPKPRPPITAVFYRKRKKIHFASASAPIPEVFKKTRNLPNLSECQACGFRIDLSNGKNRLQTLYSEWRVVLLCGKCLSRVDSSVVCSYCLMEISGEELCCGCCKRRIHRNCFLDCKDFPPWSYSCSGSEFSICIDCWIPNSIWNKQQEKSRKIKKKIEVVCALRSTGFVDIGNHNKILEIAERGPSYFANSEHKAAAVDNGEVVKEEIMATSSSPIKESLNNDRAVDDAGLALQLHHSVNRSPRISKKHQHQCYMVFKRTLKLNGHISVRIWESTKVSTDGKHQMFVNNEVKDAIKSCVDLHLPEVDGVANGLQHFMCQINGGIKEIKREVMKEGEGSCSNGVANEIKNHPEQVEIVKPKNETFGEKSDHCMRKYCRRKLSPNVNGRTEIRCYKNHL